MQALEDEFQKTQDRIDHLDSTIKLNMLRLERANKLMKLLEDEGKRWKESVEKQKVEIVKLIGDVFIAAASISYIGPFTGTYRDELVKDWIEKCRENQIPISDEYKLVSTLGNAIQIQNWNLNGLPSDSVSIDNGIIS